jgi:Glycosyltransferase family 87
LGAWVGNAKDVDTQTRAGWGNADVPVDLNLLSLRRIRQLGFAGSCVLVIGSLFAGVLPWRVVLQISPSVLHLRTYVVASVAVVFVGVALLLLAWWRLGTLIHGRGRLGIARADDLPATATPTTRELAVTLACWVAPLLIAAPLFSRDVYSYIAQGAMTVQGIDSYTFGPAILGAPLALDVPAIWLYTPAPYGPVFLTLAAQVSTITEDSTKLGILGMRVLALVGIAMLIWAVPRIARACGVNPASALWLGVLNPLVVLHLAGDAHNDAVMLGLMASGLALALGRKHVVGVVLITLAALIKAPAALALVFLVPIWAGRMNGKGTWLRVSAYTAATVAAVVVATTAVAGTGYGWVAALDTPAIAHTWTSIVTDVGYWTGLLMTALGLGTTDQALWWWRAAGLVAAAVVCLEMLRRCNRQHPVVGMGIGMSAVVVLGPVMHPWYLLWAILPLAAASAEPRIRRIVIGTVVTFALLVLPGGVQPGIASFTGAVLGAGAVFVIDRFRNSPEWRASAVSVLVTMRQMLQREPVAVNAQAADDPGGYGRHHRAVPEVFSRVDVRDVHLDQWRGQQGAGVAERVRVMRPRPGVEHDRGGIVGGLVQPGDHLRFGVGLSDLDLEAEFLADPDTTFSEVGIRGQAVDVSLPRAESTQVGPVEDKHFHDETSR